MRTNTTATVYILSENGLGSIAPGSGIVGIPYEGGESGDLLLYFEGNLHNAINQQRLEDRIVNAAGRLFTRYPTVAMRMVTKQEADRGLVQVGTIDREYRIHWNDDASRQRAQAFGALCRHGQADLEAP